MRTFILWGRMDHDKSGYKGQMPKEREGEAHRIVYANEIIRILAACDNLTTPVVRLRARAMILLMRTIGLSVMDVKTLERSAIYDGALYVQRNKTGKPVRLDLPREVVEALDRVPAPDGASADCRYFFWNGEGSRENAPNAAGMFLAKVFKKSGVAEQGRIAFGYSPWSIKRRERISSLLQIMHSGTFLGQSFQQSVSL